MDRGTLTIHACQELSHDPPLHLPLRALPFWGDGVDFIDEQEAWGDALRATVSVGVDQDTSTTHLGFLESVSQRLLRLA